MRDKLTMITAHLEEMASHAETAKLINQDEPCPMNQDLVLASLRDIETQLNIVAQLVGQLQRGC